jgi:UV DNA damage endonuclease
VRIGYPAQNLTLDCSSARTFRLASYSEDRLRQTVAGNLACLRRILEFNVEHGLLYFRLTSDLVPFASHPVCQYDWASEFAGTFAELGAYARQHGMRLALHPGQYTLINSPNDKTYHASVHELEYHAAILDLMGMDSTHKVQIHVGGVYGDKAASLRRFADRFPELPPNIQRRLAIENDERLYSVPDCIGLARLTGIPVIFDDFHYRLYDAGEPFPTAFERIAATWGGYHGVPLVDYSSQAPDKRFGSHATSIDEADFADFLDRVDVYTLDVMLEIKDKERSALKALALVRARERV